MPMLTPTTTILFNKSLNKKKPAVFFSFFHKKQTQIKSACNNINLSRFMLDVNIGFLLNNYLFVHACCLSLRIFYCRQMRSGVFLLLILFLFFIAWQLWAIRDQMQMATFFLIDDTKRDQLNKLVPEKHRLSSRVHKNS